MYNAAIVAPRFPLFRGLIMSALRPRAVALMLVISWAFAGAAVFAADAPRPNVLVFYADDK